MKPTIILCFFAGVLASCDYSTSVSVRNYKKEPCRVKVAYYPGMDISSRKDTLAARDIGASAISSNIIRTNTSDSTYYFIAPQGKEVFLRPVALGLPVIQVDLVNGDSIKAFNLQSRKQIRRWKKSGAITTKGFIFKTSIIINNK